MCTFKNPKTGYKKCVYYLIEQQTLFANGKSYVILFLFLFCFFFGGGGGGEGGNHGSQII